MNAYEQKQERRRERLERAAELAQRRSEAAFQRSRDLLSPIPFGQPILVGHHSEKRHRRTLEKADNAMRRSCEEANRAKELASRAAAVGSGGISSDDPDAPSKIRERIAELEAEHARMVDVNKRHRKGGLEALTEDERRDFARLVSICHWEKQPFPGYALSNSSANIRRLKQRLADVEQRAKVVEALEAEGAEPETIELAGGARLVQAIAENRTRLYFPGKPAADVRARLKSWGFRWCPTEGAWQRHYQQHASAAYQALGYTYNSTAQAWQAPQ